MDGPKYLIHEITDSLFSNWYIDNPRMIVNTGEYNFNNIFTEVDSSSE